MRKKICITVCALLSYIGVAMIACGISGKVVFAA